MSHLGVDLTETSVRLAHFHKGRLTHLLSAPMPDGALHGGEVLDTAAIARAIKGLLIQHRLTPKTAAFALGQHQTHAELTEVGDGDRPGDPHLRFQALAAAESHWADEEQEGAGTSAILLPPVADRREAVLVAAKGTSLRAVQSIARLAGLKLTSVDARAFIPLSLVAPVLDDGLGVVLDLDYEHPLMYLLWNGRLLIVRPLTKQVSDLEYLLRELYPGSAVQAIRAAIREADQGRIDFVDNAAYATANAVMAAVEETVNYLSGDSQFLSDPRLNSALSQQNIAQVVLVGLSAHLPGLLSAIHERANALIYQPQQYLDHDLADDHPLLPFASALTHATALGAKGHTQTENPTASTYFLELLVRGVNSPGSLLPRHIAAAVVALVVLGCAGFTLMLNSRIGGLTHQVAQAEANLQALGAALSEHQRLTAEINRLEARLRIKTTVTTTDPPWLDYFDALVNSVPIRSGKLSALVSQVAMQGIDLPNPKGEPFKVMYTLQGSAPSRAALETFIQGYEQNPRARINVSNVALGRGGREYSFSASIALAIPEPSTPWLAATAQTMGGSR